jgi:2-polyprenyl-3-methyl-5-hydroxy-6-metoxy-1,4-benzoquinol methylase
MATVSTTVVEAWDKRWTTAEGRADWLDPDPEVMALLPELMGRGARTALDLGCGVGRHALFLAERGLAVQATMAAPLVSRLRARQRKPAVSHWIYDRERPTRCRSMTEASTSCCRGM